jgi:hypothetical protein
MKHYISPEQINCANKVFLEKEPRDLFYRVATHLVEEAFSNQNRLSLAEALSVLLQTWNQSFYRFHPFSNRNLADIELLLVEHKNEIEQYRIRNISSLKDSEEGEIVSIFQSFEAVLGPVGAAKTLHLLAPEFFPIWDRTIAVAYNHPLSEAGTNGKKYFEFAKDVKDQIPSIAESLPNGVTAIKAIDEYNYCHFSKGWI